MSTPTPLTCCVCGTYAGRWQQHWNRDTEYGICPTCAAEEMGRISPQEMEQSYGKPGVNYDRPMIRHMGRRYVCMAVFSNTEAGAKAANEFMERTPGASVIDVSDAIYLAHEDDMGEPVEAPESRQASAA